jgi:hypothetical protein
MQDDGFVERAAHESADAACVASALTFSVIISRRRELMTGRSALLS